MEVGRAVIVRPKYYVFPGISPYGREAILKKMNLSNNVIVSIVCKHYNLDVKRVMSKERYRELVTARQISMYLMRKYTNQTLKEVGGYFGRDHTTAVHALQTLSNLIDTDVLNKDIEMITELMITELMITELMITELFFCY